MNNAYLPSLTEEELIHLAYVEPSTPLERELASRLASALDTIRDMEEVPVGGDT